MKNSISAAMKNKVLCNAALVYLCICCNLMLLSNTAHCKMQQVVGPPYDDPFSDYKATPLVESPQKFEQLTGLSGIQPERSSHGLKPQQNSIGNSSNDSLASPEQSHSHESEFDKREKFRKSFTEIQTTNRPVWPELTKPGGLVSSTCVDPLMTGEQEAMLLNILLAVDDSKWEPTLSQQVQLLAIFIPIRMNIAAIEEEGIDANSPIETVSGPYPLATKLMIALEPLKLRFQFKAGIIEVTTENSINDGCGVTRIYDVSPLVGQIQGGFLQLVHNIETTIEPDTWLQNGGSSTICPHVVANGQSAVSTLIVVAPNQTHLQLQALLDRLNQISNVATLPVDLPKSRPQPRSVFEASSTNKLLRFDDRVTPRGGGF
jgi:hypothetical protein